MASRLNAVSAQSIGSATSVVSPTFTSTNGSLLGVVAGGGASTITNDAISDNGTSNTWSNAVPSTGGGALQGHVGGWYSKNINGRSGHTVTDTATSDFLYIGVEEWSGIDTTAPLLLHPAAVFGTSTNPHNAAAASPGAGDVVIFGGLQLNSLANNNVFTGTGGTATIDAQTDSTTNQPGAIGSDVAAGGSVTYGYTLAPNDSVPWSIVLMTFKVAASTGFSAPLVFVPRITIPRYKRQLPLMSPQRLAYPAVALGGSFALTAAITASAAIAGTNTEAEANTAALTASAAVAGTNTEAVAVTAPLTASAAVAGTNVETVALTAGITASTAVAGTDTKAVALTGAITASVAVAATNAEAVAVTGAISSSATVAGTNVEAVALSAAITASAAVTGTATSQGAGALTASITASAAIAGTDTKAIALSAPLTSSLVISGVNVEIVALNSAIAPSAAVAGALALLGVTSPGKVGAFDRASNTVGVADHNVASVGVSNVSASTVGARDKATNTTGTSDRQVSTSGDSSWP